MKVRDIIQYQRKRKKFLTSNPREMDYREYISLPNLPEECVVIKNTNPLLHRGFPSTFNLSFTEWIDIFLIEKFGRVVGGKHDYTSLPKNSFSMITTCIRHGDIPILTKSPQHLALFHIGDISGATITDRDLKFVLDLYAKDLYEFILDMGLDINNLSITYFDGGVIEDKGIRKYFPKDPMYEYLKKYFPEKNLIPTKKDTFLSLQIFGNPAFWGYRNEILYKTKGLEVDIATIEYLPYTPIFEFDKKRERIIYKDITQTKKYFIINAFGVERMELVSEGLDHISEISLLKPQTEIVLEVLKENDRQKAHAITQGLMALHYVISECNGFSNKKLGYDFQKANISSEQIGKRGRRRRPILNKLADLILSTLSDEEKKRILNKDFLSLFFEEDIKTKILDSKLVNSDEFIQMFLEFISKRQEFINNKLNFKLT